VVVLTASNPRHMMVETVELNSRTDALTSVSPRGTCLASLSVQPASTSSRSGALSSDVVGQMGTGREADGELFRVRDACACITSRVSWKGRGERDGGDDGR